MARRGLLIILSSPSGAGKSTLSRKLRDWDATIRFSVSATTRAPRPGEVDGQDYHFRTESDFRRMVAEGEMLEHAHVFGNFYGSPLAPVRAAIEAGCDVLFDIDWQGAQQIRNSRLKDNVLSIFLLPPSIAALRARLIGRGQDAPDTIAKADAEIPGTRSPNWDAYDYVLIHERPGGGRGPAAAPSSAPNGCGRGPAARTWSTMSRRLQSEYRGQPMTLYALDGLRAQIAAGCLDRPGLSPLIGKVQRCDGGGPRSGSAPRSAANNERHHHRRGQQMWQENCVLQHRHRLSAGDSARIGNDRPQGRMACMADTNRGQIRLIGNGGATVLNGAVDRARLPDRRRRPGDRGPRKSRTGLLVMGATRGGWWRQNWKGRGRSPGWAGPRPGITRQNAARYRARRTAGAVSLSAAGTKKHVEIDERRDPARTSSQPPPPSTDAGDRAGARNHGPR